MVARIGIWFSEFNVEDAISRTYHSKAYVTERIDCTYYLARKSVLKFKDVENSTFAVSRKIHFRYSGSCSEMPP
jgi:hypothetical protein